MKNIGNMKETRDIDHKLLLFKDKIEELEKELDYTYKNKYILIEALTHKSYTNENKTSKSNERLEFLGDAVLGNIIAKQLYLETEKNEGISTIIRSKMVDKEACYKYAIYLKLDKYIIMGQSEQNFEKGKISILACAFEAILGSIYIDSNDISICEHLMRKCLNGTNNSHTFQSHYSDFKSLLQIYCQKNNLPLHLYSSVPSSNLFSVSVIIDSPKFYSDKKPLILGHSISSKIKDGQKKAAEQALLYINSL